VLATSDRGVLAGFALAVGPGAGFAEELGWTGFALPRLQRSCGWLVAGLVAGVVWGLWHLLPDYWGNADAWGLLYGPRFLLWCGVAFVAYRVLIAWVYQHTESLLLAQLMQAGFTGGQALLMPAVTPSLSGMAWYAAFAAALVLLASGVAIFDRVYRPVWGHVGRRARRRTHRPYRPAF
jgi:membrane protease YdiL (CAAX protease family)